MVATVSVEKGRLIVASGFREAGKSYSPFKGEAGREMGFRCRIDEPHPHPNPPLEREGT
jgi:hypothetical protein